MIYWTLLVLNALFATVWGVLKFWRNYRVRYMQETSATDNIEFYSQILNGVMLTVSFAILIYAIVKIRRFIVHNGLRNQINSRMICLHVVCFGSYVLANVLLFTEIGYYSFKLQTDNPQHAQVVMWMWIVSLVLTFIVQTSLILIFMEIGKMNPMRKYTRLDSQGNY